jgi:hypothetical protein
MDFKALPFARIRRTGRVAAYLRRFEEGKHVRTSTAFLLCLEWLGS